MKICEKHWKDLVNNLPVSVLPKVSIEISTMMFSNESDGDKYDWDYRKFIEDVEAHGGCPICFKGEEFYNKIVEKLNGDYKEDEREKRIRKDWNKGKMGDRND